MIIKFLSAFCICLFTVSLQAQSHLEAVLFDIAENNKTLQSQRKYWDAQKLQFNTGITLYDPAITYDFMRGVPYAVAGNQTDITITQRFDFPTVYRKKKDLAKEQSEQIDFSLTSLRQTILLESKKICIELIYRNKLRTKISERKTKTEKFLSDFQVKLEKGEGNILDVNKAKIQLIEINKEYHSNISSINQLNQKLTELNGGNEIIFRDTIYPTNLPVPSFEEMHSIIENSDPVRSFLEQKVIIAQKDIAVMKALTLPTFEAGLHHQSILGQKFYGGKLSVSIPLWENKNRVNHKQAELIFAETQVIQHINEHYSELKQSYEKLIYIKKTLEEYRSVLNNTTATQLLDKALAFGEITTIQYFLEINYFYTAINNFLLAEKEYNDALAEIFKHQL